MSIDRSTALKLVDELIKNKPDMVKVHKLCKSSQIHVDQDQVKQMQIVLNALQSQNIDLKLKKSTNGDKDVSNI